MISALPSTYCWKSVQAYICRHHRQCMEGWLYLCLLSAILRMSQVLVNFVDNSRARPHSCSSDQARSGPMALANKSATFSTLMGTGPSLRLPFSDSWGVGLELLFCSRCRRSFHSSKVSGIHPAHRNTEHTGSIHETWELQEHLRPNKDIQEQSLFTSVQIFQTHRIKIILKLPGDVTRNKLHTPAAIRL